MTAPIVELTRNARAATGDNIGTVVKAGKWAIARYTAVPGKRTLSRELLTEWTTAANVANILREMAA